MATVFRTPPDQINRVGIFMAGTQAANHSSTAAAMLSRSAAAAAAGAGGLIRPPVQVMSDLFDVLAVLMAEANPADQEAHDAEVAKVREQIVQAKADLAAERDRMAAERAALDAQAYKLMLDQSASQEVLKRKHRSRLPLGFDPRNLFYTPGAGASNPPGHQEVIKPGRGTRARSDSPTPPDGTSSAEHCDSSTGPDTSGSLFKSYGQSCRSCCVIRSYPGRRRLSTGNRNMPG